MISLPSSELITGENAVLQVNCQNRISRTPFDHCVHIYICQGNATFILQMHTHVEELCSKTLFSNFYICVPVNVSDVKLFICPGILRWCFFSLSYEIVKYLISLKVLKGLLKRFCRNGFLNIWIISLDCFIPSRDLASVHNTNILSFPRTHPTAFRLMCTADFGNMEQFYLAIQMITIFSKDTTKSIWGFDLLRLEMMAECSPRLHS